MGRTYDPQIVAELMAKCGGRCTICNAEIMRDWRTYKNIRTAEKAHIKAFSDKGPRADKNLPKEQRNDYDNLIILCPSCHATIDEKLGRQEYTVEWLKKIKEEKEAKIKKMLDALNAKECDLIKYTSVIGNQNFNLYDCDIRKVCFYNGFFSHNDTIDLSESNDEENIASSIIGLDKKFAMRIQRSIDGGKSNTYCLFAKAPQPLLVYLGRLFNDKHDVKVFTAHRNNVWKYNDQISNVNFSILRPESFNKGNKVVLLVNSTATIGPERVEKAFGKNVDLWQINSSDIGVDKINNQEELSRFYSIVVSVLDEIGLIYGKEVIVNLLPAMSNSLAITFGRAIFNKSHNKINIYDSKKLLDGTIVDVASIII